MQGRSRGYLSVLSISLMAASVSLLAPLFAQASYLPGETLNPSCLPTDSTCIVTSLTASSTANSFPYYASNGSVLSATSTLTILTNNNVGIGTTTPGSLFSISGIANFTTATSTFYGNGLNLTNGCYAVNGTCLSTGATLSFTYPLINTANTISTAFGTTTANSFNQLQQFNANASTTALTVTGNTYFPGSGIWNSTGNVGIGTTSPYAKLSVVGEVVAANFTATSTTATTTLNGGFAVGTGASPSGLVYDRSTGRVGVGTAAPSALFTVNSTAPFTVTSAGVITGGTGVSSVIGDVAFSGFGGIYGNTGTLNLGGNSSDIIIYPQSHTETSGTVEPVLVGNGASFAPTSGTGVYNFVSMNPVINQTGGANGITRGIYINPTLTSAPDFRAIETVRGNVVFGSTSGNVGIGTTTPYAKLSVWGTDTASTTSFLVANSASTTVFAVYNNGNATYSGLIFQSSDQRLKTNITPLDASSSLAAIEGLTPVSYTRLDQSDLGTNLGFLAQDVQQIFPNLVSTTSPTSLTPDGTLTLNYGGLIAPIVEAIKALAGEVRNFAKSITTAVVNATTVNSQQSNTQKLCVGSTCITEPELKAILQNNGQTVISPPTISDGGADSSAATSGNSAASMDATSTPSNLSTTPPEALPAVIDPANTNMENTTLSTPTPPQDDATTTP